MLMVPRKSECGKMDTEPVEVFQDLRQQIGP
jgi:hypothetical protein